MKREVVTVYLRSGQSVKVECDEWKFSKDATASFIDYTFEGLNEGEFVSFDVKEIVGYSVIEVEVISDNK